MIDVPNCTASAGNASVSSPIARLIQPRRMLRARIGVLDLLHGGEVRPVRHLAARWRGRPPCRPSIHCCSSGCQVGVQPEQCRSCSRLPSGTAIEPRRPRYAGSPYGTTTLMPSIPPRRLITTTTLLSRLRAEDRLAEDPAERRVCDAERTGADQALQHASPRDTFGARVLLAHLVAVIGAVRVSVSGVGAGEGAFIASCAPGCRGWPSAAAASSSSPARGRRRRSRRRRHPVAWRAAVSSRSVDPRPSSTRQRWSTNWSKRIRGFGSQDARVR